MQGWPYWTLGARRSWGVGDRSHRDQAHQSDSRRAWDTECKAQNTDCRAQNTGCKAQNTECWSPKSSPLASYGAPLRRPVLAERPKAYLQREELIARARVFELCDRLFVLEQQSQRQREINAIRRPVPGCTLFRRAGLSVLGIAFREA
eukprot:2228019-Rhodomonas_salina.3